MCIQLIHTRRERRLGVAVGVAEVGLVVVKVQLNLRRWFLFDLRRRRLSWRDSDLIQIARDVLPACPFPSCRIFVFSTVPRLFPLSSLPLLSYASNIPPFCSNQPFSLTQHSSRTGWCCFFILRCVSISRSLRIIRMRES